jgi:thiamine biosynthesis lipoprotein
VSSISPGDLRGRGSVTDPFPLHRPVTTGVPDLVLAFRAMASDVRIRVVEPSASALRAIDAAQQIFEEVERACTRFDPGSPLMRANADPDSWHHVPVELFEAVREAAQAHHLTTGLFDPRVLRTLESYGYDRSLPFAAGPVTTAARPVSTQGVQAPAAAWAPELDDERRAIRLGPEPIDLGGIGKGLAVRWAAARLAGAGGSVLVEAGGDCHLRGAGPDGDGWRVGIEDPSGGAEPVAVLALADLACATSSIRLRRWRAGEQAVHHLIDPRTGRPGGAGLTAVTVVAPDPAIAEVWSKSLFLAGIDRIDSLARQHDLAALWVADSGKVTTSPVMDRLVIWRAPDGD